MTVVVIGAGVAGLVTARRLEALGRAVREGDLVSVPAGVPHLPGNPSTDGPAFAVVARTDPNEQESAVPMPELDERAVRPDDVP